MSSKKNSKGKAVTPKVKETAIQEEEVKVPVIEEISTVAKIGVVANCKALNVRKSPSLDAEIVTVLDETRVVKILDTKNDFYKVEIATDQVGYCMKKFIEVKE